MLPLRTIGFLGAYSTLLLVAFVLPAAGVWGFVFESNYHPPYNLWWGKHLLSIGDRWSLYIGAVMILATLLHWSRNNVRVFTHLPSLLLIGFTLNSFLVTSWAYDPQASWEEAIDNLKWLAVYICIIKTHSDRRWLPVVLYIYLFACADWGWDNTFDPLGGRRVRGGPVTCGDENFVSAHVVALIPVLACLVLSAKTPRWMRAFFLISAPFMLNIVAHAQSRGTFLSLIAAAATVPLLAKGRLRTWAIGGLILGSLVSMRLFHDQFWSRMATIETYQQDGSAEGRIEAWKDAWHLSVVQPFGNGGEAFDRGLKSQSKSTHNMYLECLVAWGFQGTLLWLLFIGSTMWECHRIARRLYQPRQWPQQREYLIALGILIGMIGMLVAAVFLNRMRWELWWIYGGIVLCLKNLVPAVESSRSGHGLFIVMPANSPVVPASLHESHGLSASIRP